MKKEIGVTIPTSFLEGSSSFQVSEPLHDVSPDIAQDLFIT
jgi:hypothetical protein